MTKRYWKWISWKEGIIALTIVCAIAVGSFASFGEQCQSLRTEVIRLHILANSDIEIDQTVKLEVRDRILEETGAAFAQPATKSSAEKSAREILPKIEEIAQNTLIEHGFPAKAKAEFCNMYFNTRKYDDYTLPAGMYDAVRVTLGTGEGKNWWCVMYPPICVPAATPSNGEIVNKIEELDAQPLLVPKLAVIEIFESAKKMLTTN